MKQSSLTNLNAIPINTNTLAGQWMTFSHMANHYRKLLNVKPRVDSGLMSSHSATSYNNISMQSSKPLSKKMGCTNIKPKKSTNTSLNNNSVSHDHLQRSQLYRSHPDSLHISEKIDKEAKSSIQNKTPAQPSYLHDEYQVVFGPSSIRSSIDAFMSDETDSTMSNEKPQSEDATPLGVTEKIRRFLNHIHQFDLTTSKPKRVTTAPLTTASVSESKCKQQSRSSVSTLANNSSIDFRLSRHAKCFLPCECHSPNSPRKSTTKSTTSTVIKKPKKADSLMNSRKSTTSCKPLVAFDQPSNRAHHFYSPKESRKAIHLTEKDMLPEKDLNGRKPDKSRKRASSIASIGTICGSDELTAEDFLISAKHISSTIETGRIDNSMHRRGDNHKTKKVVLDGNSHGKVFGKNFDNHATSSTKSLLKSTSMTSIPNSIKPNHYINGVSNNKDSSRDSAYGFSSGESRITTRESTPEKKCHRILASGGTTNTHVHLEDKPCKDIPVDECHRSAIKIPKSRKELREQDDHYRTKFSTDQHNHSVRIKKGSGRGHKTKSTIDLNRKESSDRYITFLADVTQDIVSKGIYTNKGLKILFKTHMDQNKALDPDKLADMLEHLRMDLGIPKDDALDKIEFGYGSVTNPTNTTFFYTPSELKKSGSKVPATAVITDENLNQSLPSTSSSPHTVIPTTQTSTTGFFSGPNTSSNQSTTTTEEGVDIISVPSSDRDENEKNPIDEIEDDLSLSESEVTQALRIAGLDDGTTEEVVGILKC